MKDKEEDAYLCKRQLPDNEAIKWIDDSEFPEANIFEHTKKIVKEYDEWLKEHMPAITYRCLKEASRRAANIMIYGTITGSRMNDKISPINPQNYFTTQIQAPLGTDE